MFGVANKKEEDKKPNRKARRARAKAERGHAVASKKFRFSVNEKAEKRHKRFVLEIKNARRRNKSATRWEVRRLIAEKHGVNPRRVVLLSVVDEKSKDNLSEVRFSIRSWKKK